MFPNIKAWEDVGLATKPTYKASLHLMVHDCHPQINDLNPQEWGVQSPGQEAKL